MVVKTIDCLSIDKIKRSWCIRVDKKVVLDKFKTLELAEKALEKYESLYLYYANSASVGCDLKR